MNLGPSGMFLSQEPFKKLRNFSCVGTKGTKADFSSCAVLPRNFLLPVSELLLSRGPGTTELATGLHTYV